MVPQARSEATRQKILDAAIDLFSEVGYAAAGLGEIIERAGMTKGALYHHFDSKEALATAIIEQGTNLTRDAFRHVCESSSPALENMIHGVFVVTDLACLRQNGPHSRTTHPRTGRIQQRSLPSLAQPVGRDDNPGQPRKHRRRPPRRPRSLRGQRINPQRHARRPTALQDSRRQRSHQATNPIPRTSPAQQSSPTHHWPTSASFLPASPYATPRPPAQLTEHTNRTIARPPTAAPSNSQTSPTQPDHRDASAPTCSSWPAPSNPHNAAAPRPDSPVHRRQKARITRPARYGRPQRNASPAKLSCW